MELAIFVVLSLWISAVAGWITIPSIVLISKKKRLFDAISDRKSHTGAIPRLGGISFFPSFLFTLSLVTGLRYYYGFEISSGHETTAFKEIMFLITGGTLLFIVGFADDLNGVSYKNKFIAQIAAGIVLLYSGVGITNLGGLFGLHEISPIAGGIISILVIVLITNAYNLIDGIDGLCSGLALLALYYLGVWFMLNNLFIYSIIAMSMAGVVSTFFFYNVMGSRLKIFMGDTGSLLLGFTIAFLGLKFYNLNLNADSYGVSGVPALLLGIVFIPVFDTLRVFCVRMSRGLSPFHPDKRHIHHKMLKMGLTHINSTMIIILIQACFILLNLVLRNININILFVINLTLGILLIKYINKLGNRNAPIKTKTGKKS